MLLLAVVSSHETEPLLTPSPCKTVPSLLGKMLKRILDENKKFKSNCVMSEISHLLKSDSLKFPNLICSTFTQETIYSCKREQKCTFALNVLACSYCI